MRLKMIAGVVGGALLLLAVGVWATNAARPTETEQPSQAFSLTVTKIVDGDTIRAIPDSAQPSLAVGEESRVRLIGINTPERDLDDADQSECGAEIASESLADLVPVGAKVWALFDQEPRDRYDRALLYLWTGDGVFVNNQMVAEGYAQTLEIRPNVRYADVFQASEREARFDSAGLWKLCPPRAG